MKVRKPKSSIQDVFEIRLDQKIFGRVRVHARRRKISCSWVVRLCVFHLISQYRGWDKRLVAANTSEKGKYQDPEVILHRHLLCLYGEDAMVLRIFAGKMGISLTRLVRIACRLYLERLIRDSDEQGLVRRGIKWIRNIILPELDMDFHTKHLIFQPFERADYWPRPTPRSTSLIFDQ